MKRTLKLVLYYFGYQLAFTVVASVISVVLAHLGMVDKDVAILNATAIALLLSGIMMGWHLIHFKYITFGWKSFGEVPAKSLWLSIPFILASMVFINLCSEFIDLPNWMENDFFAMSRNLFGILSVAVMAPVVEEFLFRGAIEGHLLRQGKKPWTAIFISALVFGLIHINPAQVPFAFAIGLVFGWLYYRTGSMMPGILGHFINNSIACIQMATLSKEELNTKTVDMIGETATCLLFAASFLIMIGTFLYMKKHLPEAPEYKEDESLTI